VNRQMPAENQNMETITYISTQFGHESLSESIIVDRLRETGNIQDLREEWNQYLETVEDSLRAEQEQLEE